MAILYYIVGGTKEGGKEASSHKGDRMDVGAIQYLFSLYFTPVQKPEKKPLEISGLSLIL